MNKHFGTDIALDQGHIIRSAVGHEIGEEPHPIGERLVGRLEPNDALSDRVKCGDRG
jgi:hypothetical protein